MGRVARSSLAAVGLLTLLLSTTTDHHVCARTAADIRASAAALNAV
jgi:hypothetical protein